MSNVVITSVMVTIECVEQGLNTLTKAAMSRGMSEFVLVVYSNVLALVLLLLVSIIHYRKRSYPRITFSVLWKVFLLGIFASAAQVFMAMGIKYSSPTLAAVMTDLTPAFTFILAMFFGMEKLDFRIRSSQAKLIGTILSIGGAVIVTLYKGPPIMPAQLHSSSPHKPLQSAETNWVIGGTLLAAAGFSISSLIIIQVKLITAWITKDFPHILMMTLLGCFFVTILATSVSVISERDPEAWKLRFDISLVAVIYSAIMVTALRSLVHAWAIHRKGPIFVAMFKPLGIVIAVAMGVTLLGDTLYGGSVLGAAIIALGFYSVIWGQSKQDKLCQEHKICCSSESSADMVPLLQNRNTNV
ncbi:EamA domain [Dillenia turbinata]|uniref:WAT1-related protein n=1 Tax=Dillenia turbinata TaxID=194707 RepID=A0AAN8V2K1_9MAGN